VKTIHWPLSPTMALLVEWTSLVASASVGFVFASRLASRSKAILIGLIYFPIALLVLSAYSLLLSGWFFGDSL
jgi:CHASE2 domain-containing sensor protein